MSSDTNPNIPVSVGAITILGRIEQKNTTFGKYDTCGKKQQVCRYNGGFGAIISDGPTSGDTSYPGDPDGRWTSADVPIRYATNICGTAYVNAECYTFDPATCPNLGGNAPGNKFFNAGPSTDCYYNASIFTNPQAVLDYATNFGKNETYLNYVAPTLCARKADRCTDVSQLTSCSNLFTYDDVTRGICDEWRRIAPPTLVDSVSSAYCVNNNTEDCSCFNRQASQDYQLAKGLGLSFAPDACWYVPCSNPTTALIPLDVSAGVPSCANIQVCSTLTQIIAGGNVNFNPNLQSVINCDFSNTPTNPTTPVNPPPPPVVPPSDGASSKLILYLVLGLAILLILFLVIMWLLR
jgi:hypothetical protein